MSPKVKEDGDGARAGTKRKSNSPVKESDDYKRRRDKNNIAVRKSREKSRAKAKETQEKVARLKKENEDLEMKVMLLSKELSVLKDLFLSHATTVVPDTCPGVIKAESKVEVKAEHKVKDEDQGELQEEIEYVTFEVGSPVNQEGFQNDHEYFSHRERLYAK